MNNTTNSWEMDFDEFYALPEMMIPGPQREKAIKDFIRTLLHDTEIAAREELIKKIKSHPAGMKSDEDLIDRDTLLSSLTKE